MPGFHSPSGCSASSSAKVCAAAARFVKADLIWQTVPADIMLDVGEKQLWYAIGAI